MGIFRAVVKANVIAAAAGNYGAGDVISQSASADAGVAMEWDVATGRATIWEIQLRVSEDTVTFRARLHLFSSQPLAAEVEMDDNVAFIIKTEAGDDKYIGYIDLPALADRGTRPAFTQKLAINKGVTLDGHSVWVVIETLDAETNEAASMTLDFEVITL